MRVIYLELVGMQSKKVMLPSDSIVLDIERDYNTGTSCITVLSLGEKQDLHCEIQVAERLEEGWEFISRMQCKGKYTYGMVQGLPTPREYGVVIGKTLPVKLGDKYWMFNNTPCAEPDSTKVLTCNAIMYAKHVRRCASRLPKLT